MPRFSSLSRTLRLTSEAWPLVASVRLALWRESFPAFHARWSAEVERELREALPSALQDPHSPGDQSHPQSDQSHPQSDQGYPQDEQGEPDALTRQLVWDCSHAVSRAARLVPRASCLTQALVLQRVLARRGQRCALFLGVDRPGPKASEAPARSRNGVEAHAWIEWHGRVLIGGDISRWTPFPLHPASAPDAAHKARLSR